MNEGIMVILSSPSGAGKTTLVKLLSERKGFVTSISHTTRTPRSNEVDGKDYYFISEEEFNSKVSKNEMLEHAEVFGNFYGTPKDWVLSVLSKKENVLLELDIQGALQVKEAFPEAKTHSRS